MTTLQLLICTIDDGIAAVPRVLLPPTDGVSYVVSWQHTSPPPYPDVPAALRRADVALHHLDGAGLSRNRNNCLRHASADICLIADDDCQYTPQGLQAVVDTFDRDSALDLAAFRMDNPSAPKQYPEHAFDLAQPPRFYSVSSVELAVRRATVVPRVQFNEAFGLGAPRLHCAEESVFVHDVLAAGLKGAYFPIVVPTHDCPTTAQSRAGRAGVLQGMGANLYVNYRSKMLLYPLPMARRLHRHHGVGLWYALRHLYAGLAYAITHPALMRQGQIPSDNNHRT